MDFRARAEVARRGMTKGRKAKKPAVGADGGPVFSTQQDLPSVQDGVRKAVLDFLGIERGA
jgi:hypothetical protein